MIIITHDASERVDPPFVRVVILTFNAGRHLRACLESVLELDWPADRFEVIVIDNASTDGSVASIDDLVVDTSGPVINVVHTGSNQGFGANNLAMADLDGVDRVALVNPDARVRPSWLGELSAALDDDERIGAACPLILLSGSHRRLSLVPDDPDRPHRLSILNPPNGTHVAGGRVGRTVWAASGSDGDLAWEFTGRAELRVDDAHDVATIRFDAVDGEPTGLRVGVMAGPDSSSTEFASIEYSSPGDDVTLSLVGPTFQIVQNAGSTIGPSGLGSNNRFLSVLDRSPAESSDVDAWCGAGVLLRSDYLRDVGGFDERLFLYYEDTDLSWRGKRRGWRYRFIPSAVMEHQHSFSTGGASALRDHHHLRNRLLVVTKNGTPRQIGAAWWDALRAAAGQSKHEIWRPLRAGHRPELLLAPRHVRALGDAVRLAPAFLRSRKQT